MTAIIRSNKRMMSISSPYLQGTAIAAAAPKEIRVPTRFFRQHCCRKYSLKVFCEDIDIYYLHKIGLD
jgi:hypothetical protein